MKKLFIILCVLASAGAFGFCVIRAASSFSKLPPIPTASLPSIFAPKKPVPASPPEVYGAADETAVPSAGHETYPTSEPDTTPPDPGIILPEPTPSNYGGEDDEPYECTKAPDGGINCTAVFIDNSQDLHNIQVGQRVHFIDCRHNQAVELHCRVVVP